MPLSPLVRIFTLQFFASNETQNYEKHAYMHHVKSGTCLGVCPTGSRIRGVKTKRMVYSRISCTSFHAALLARFSFFLMKRSPTLNHLAWQIFMKLISVLLHFRKKKKQWPHEWGKKGRTKLQLDRGQRCRLMTDTYAHEDMIWQVSSLGDEVWRSWFMIMSSYWHDRLVNDYVSSHDNEMIDSWME